MEPRHPQHRYLRQTRPLPALALTPSADVTQALRTADPTRSGDPATLERIWAASLGVAGEAVVVAAGRELALSRLMACLLGPDDVVALAGPADPDLRRAVLLPGARWVDLGRDARWGLQTEALDRVLADGVSSLCVFSRPGPLGLPVDPLSAVERALDAGQTVVVDEEYLAWAAPGSVSALALLGLHPERLIVLRGMPEAGLGDRSPVLLVAPGLASRLRPALPPAICEPALAGALAALADPLGLAAAARGAAATVSSLAAALAPDPDHHVSASAGPRLLVRRYDGQPLGAVPVAAEAWTDGDSALRDATVLTPR